MKKYISIICAVLVTLIAGSALAFDWNVPWDKQKRTEMEKDKKEGYSEEQRDYKAKRKRTQTEKEGEGYYNGSYHHKSGKYKKGEWQFVK